MTWRERLAGLWCVTALYTAWDEGWKELVRLTQAVANRWGDQAVSHYTALYRYLSREGFDSLGDWLWDRLRYQETPYGMALDRGEADESLTAAARAECALLQELCGLSGEEWKEAMGAFLTEGYAAPVAAMPAWAGRTPFDFEKLTAFYRAQGCGLFARYSAFLWDGEQLTPVPDPDRPGPEEMLGYGWQRKAVEENTAALLAGKGVNNVLLFGEGGTGKSATVKSLLALPGFEALRLVQVERAGLAKMPQLIRRLGQRRQKFILFIDDLSFDQDDETYSVLKTILEGGLEKRPANVAIYATSNRRHLVRQTFSARAGDEVDVAESIAEKTSLAERFGLRIPYLTLSRGEYLEMVEGMARLHGVAMDRENLHKRALQWELEHHGRTPRTAKQFIASL